LGLALGLGLVLGYVSAMPRVKRLEKELEKGSRKVMDLELLREQWQNQMWKVRE
jgi:hypothetical protein